MNKIWNINLLLCREVNRNVSKIEGVFDKLVLNEKEEANFTIVTLLNSIKSDEEKFGLYYFLEQVNEDKDNLLLYLCSSINVREKNDEKKDANLCSIEGFSHKNIVFEIENCSFPGEGIYEIKVYKYDTDDVVKVDDNISTKDMVKYANDDHLVSVYSFEVEKNS